MCMDISTCIADLMCMDISTWIADLMSGPMMLSEKNRLLKVSTSCVCAECSILWGSHSVNLCVDLLRNMRTVHCYKALHSLSHNKALVSVS